MLIAQVTQSGEAHGLINTLTNSCEFNDFKHMTPATKAKLEKEKKEEARIVKAEYINRTGRHERLIKAYCRYAGDPIQIWNFIPGRTYEVPYGLVKEVNQVRMPKRSGLMEVDGEKINKDGSPLAQDQEGDWNHKFISIDFKAA
jgi:hypothetical protein